MKQTKSAAQIHDKSKCKQSTCKNCGVDFQYYPPVEKGDYCSWDCRYECHDKIVEGLYTPALRKTKRLLAIEQFKDPQQRQIRSEKLTGREVSEITREKLSDAKVSNSFTMAKRKVIDARGCGCERCGKPLEGWDLCIHHVDGCQWNQDPDNLMILCRTCHGKLHNALSLEAGKFHGKATVANYVAKILKLMGVDLQHPDFKDTPLRVARCYEEMFEGVGRKEEAINILKASFPTENDEMIVISAKTCSLCPHHLLPVEYNVWFGYIPNKRALGLSKVSRLCDLLAHQPILQENLTTDIAALAMKYLKPKGVAVRLVGSHSCMRVRGVKQSDSTVITTSLLGIFREQKVKQEFLGECR